MFVALQSLGLLLSAARIWGKALGCQIGIEDKEPHQTGGEKKGVSVKLVGCKKISAFAELCSQYYSL